jgi:hypothetical protein
VHSRDFERDEEVSDEAEEDEIARAAIDANSDLTAQGLFDLQEEGLTEPEE